MTANARRRQPPDPVSNDARVEPEPPGRRQRRDPDGSPDHGRPSGQDRPDIGGAIEDEPPTIEIETSLWFG